MKKVMFQKKLALVNQNNERFVIIGIFQIKILSICNGCPDVILRALIFHKVSIFFVKRSDYRMCFWYISRDDVINIKKKSDLKKQIAIRFFLIQKMNNKTIYYQRNRERILNRAKEYYKNNKKILREEARTKYRELSNGKNIKREYGRNKYKNISKENKQRLKEYQKNYREAKK